MKHARELIEQVIENRDVQLAVNAELVNGRLKVPVHLALGHEAIAVSVVGAMAKLDQILLTHRNIHYHIALGATVEKLIAEYELNPTGLAEGKLGSMNLCVPSNRNIYTSNILGNNLSVALGVAKSNELLNRNSVTWVITGDGAIEEGAFYESLLTSSSWNLPVIYVVENNKWSLGTEISERRTQINLKNFCDSLGVEYLDLSGNNVADYCEKLSESRKNAVLGQPVVVEAHLETLGGFFVEENSVKRYINYHAGKAKLSETSRVLIENSSDPVFVNLNIFKSGGLC